MLIAYEFDIVGGPFDGAPGMSWADDGKHPLPELIFVGVCGKGSDCGSSACKVSATHISFWTPEEDPPAKAVSYVKENEHVVRVGEDLCGRAVYALGGLTDPRNFGAAARELVTA